MRDRGHVGYTEATEEAMIVKDFAVDGGEPLLERSLKARKADRGKHDPELPERVVWIDWINTSPREEAEILRGMFASPNVVCKLRDPATAEFLERAFEVQS